jgi:hypothetical protein
MNARTVAASLPKILFIISSGLSIGRTISQPTSLEKAVLLPHDYREERRDEATEKPSAAALDRVRPPNQKAPLDHCHREINLDDEGR